MAGKLKVLFISSEVAPFAKTGGLADVAGSLPPVLAGQDLDIRIAMPRYKGVDCPMDTRLDFFVNVGERKETAIIREYRQDTEALGQKVPVYFVDNYHFFDREQLYGYHDDAARFAFFCQAVLEMLPRLGFQPDVIHCNDWQTGPVAVLLKEKYGTEPFYTHIATIFTIHNLQYQGNFGRECLKLLGLSESFYTPEKLEFYGNVSYLKSGLIYSDLINTVSRSYAEEITTPEYGERVDGILRGRSNDLYGIVNGIDYAQFDPSKDPLIEANYSYTDLEKKEVNKAALQRIMNLPETDVPLLGVVSRLATQKGLDLLGQILSSLMSRDVQVVLLGTGENYFENLFKEATTKYPDKFAAFIGFNASLAQKVYAGSDMFLMPSKFEPCGLGQLISLRYGTIPIVRETGGLADTIRDYSRETGQGNGFAFAEATGEEFLKAIDRALNVYNDKKAWVQLVQNAMQCDFSWLMSATEYIQLYKTAARQNTAI